MTSIKETANGYVGKMIKNISELEKVPMNLNITEVEYFDNEGKSFPVNEIELNQQKYRIPNSVLKQLKIHLIQKPNMEFFRVIKEGEGLNTAYTVIPL